MTQEWKVWSGGECPVPPNTLVEYKLRDGYTSTSPACELLWRHVSSGGDILAYRVLPIQDEPKPDEWTDLPTFQDVAKAIERTDEIEEQTIYGDWRSWGGGMWSSSYSYRSRPRKPATKTVVMREALHQQHSGNFAYLWLSGKQEHLTGFVRYTGKERTEEVLA